MTTIACRSGIIAADSQETWDEGIKTPCIKLHQFKKGKWKGCVIGWAGASFLSQLIIEKLEGRRGLGERPDMVDLEMEGSAMGIILAPDGIWTINESCVPKKELLDFYAIGAGGQGAFALMKAADFSAEEAVRAMCEIDPYTGGEVLTMTLQPRKRLLL